MKKLFIILTVVALLALLCGCVNQDKTETVKAASSSSAAPAKTSESAEAKATAPSTTPAPDSTVSPSQSAPDSQATTGNSKELDKEIDALSDELKQLKDLFGDINFDGMNEF
jgi:Flp pilus assembly protein TadD